MFKSLNCTSTACLSRRLPTPFRLKFWSTARLLTYAIFCRSGLKPFRRLWGTNSPAKIAHVLGWLPIWSGIWANSSGNTKQSPEDHLSSRTIQTTKMFRQQSYETFEWLSSYLERDFQTIWTLFIPTYLYQMEVFVSMWWTPTMSLMTLWSYEYHFGPWMFNKWTFKILEEICEARIHLISETWTYLRNQQ